MTHRAEDLPHRISTELDALIDGRLDASSRPAVDEAIAIDAAASAEHRLATRVDASIRRMFVAPRRAIDMTRRGEAFADEPRAALGDGRRRSHGMDASHASHAGDAGDAGQVSQVNQVNQVGHANHAWRRRAALVGIAAMIALTLSVALSWFAWFAPRWHPAPDVAVALTPVSLYRNLLVDGFEPMWSCADEAEFVRYTATEFGQAFRIAPVAEIEVLGWTYGCSLLSARTGVLLARAEGAPVVVLVDRLRSDHGLAAPDDPALHVHRRELESLVLYEISTEARPRVIPLVNAARSE
ncbi:MAG: hypothetical protein U0575_06090 [Phycisphaerales bacterium]